MPPCANKVVLTIWQKSVNFWANVQHMITSKKCCKHLKVQTSLNEITRCHLRDIPCCFWKDNLILKDRRQIIAWHKTFKVQFFVFNMLQFQNFKMCIYFKPPFLSYTGIKSSLFLIHTHNHYTCSVTQGICYWELGNKLHPKMKIPYYEIAID